MNYEVFMKSLQSIVEKELELNRNIRIHDLESRIRKEVPDASIGEICKYRAFWLRWQKHNRKMMGRPIANDVS
jgi:hypothetical protein